MNSTLDIPRYELEKCWPNLELNNHHKTSDKSDKYNCFAWAIDKNDDKWAPYSGYAWFPGFPKFDITDDPENDLDNYKAGFESIGYKECSDGEPEKGFEKIALYTIGKSVKHAAKQLENGHWTSKLGKHDDIEHNTVNVLEGLCYGKVTIFMKREIPIKLNTLLKRVIKLFNK